MNHFEVVQSVSNWFKNQRNVEVVTRFSYSFPVPDIQVQYVDGSIVQIECKPSNAPRREYLTGLGQAIAFYKHSDKAYLALPSWDYQLIKDYLWPDFIGIILVDYSNVYIAREPVPPDNITFVVEKEKINRGYAYYRDLKTEEIFQVLSEINSAIGILHTNPREIDGVIWNALRRIRKWTSSEKSNILNTKLLLRDLKLFDIRSLEVTEIGKELLSINLNDKEKIRTFFRKLFLIEGNYIDIVGLIQELNDEQGFFQNVGEFKNCLRDRIIQEKLATRKTNVTRDLTDIIRMLFHLEVISRWNKNKDGLGKYFVLWKNIIHFVKYR